MSSSWDRRLGVSRSISPRSSILINLRPSFAFSIGSMFRTWLSLAKWASMFFGRRQSRRSSSYFISSSYLLSSMISFLIDFWLNAGIYLAISSSGMALARSSPCSASSASTMTEGAGKIESSNLDGSDRKVVVSGLHWPQGIAIFNCIANEYHFNPICLSIN